MLHLIDLRLVHARKHVDLPTSGGLDEGDVLAVLGRVDRGLAVVGLLGEVGHLGGARHVADSTSTRAASGRADLGDRVRAELLHHCFHHRLHRLGRLGHHRLHRLAGGRRVVDGVDQDLRPRDRVVTRRTQACNQSLEVGRASRGSARHRTTTRAARVFALGFRSNLDFDRRRHDQVVDGQAVGHFLHAIGVGLEPSSRGILARIGVLLSGGGGLLLEGGDGGLSGALQLAESCGGLARGIASSAHEHAALRAEARDLRHAHAEVFAGQRVAQRVAFGIGRRGGQVGSGGLVGCFECAGALVSDRLHQRVGRATKSRSHLAALGRLAVDIRLKAIQKVERCARRRLQSLRGAQC